tara:strand:+ start:2993 stop:3298 length:306 start_codon:yes stop_codon:yes gene_type:complete
MTVMTKSTTPNNAIHVVYQGQHNLASLVNSTNATEGSAGMVPKLAAQMVFGASAHSKSFQTHNTSILGPPVIQQPLTALVRRSSAMDKTTTATVSSMRPVH